MNKPIFLYLHPIKPIYKTSVSSRIMSIFLIGKQFILQQESVDFLCFSSDTAYLETTTDPTGLQT